MSVLVKLNKAHRHNGLERKAGEKVRLPTAMAIALMSHGRAVECDGKDLVAERDKKKAAAERDKKKKRQ